MAPKPYTIFIENGWNGQYPTGNGGRTMGPISLHFGQPNYRGRQSKRLTSDSRRPISTDCSRFRPIEPIATNDRCYGGQVNSSQGSQDGGDWRLAVDGSRWSVGRV